jgi:hypothetical protein
MFLRMRNVLDKICKTNQNTRFMYSKFVFPKFVPFMRKFGRSLKACKATDNNIIRRMRFACWINKVTDTHSEYITLIAFARQL